MLTRVKGLKISLTPELKELNGEEMIPYQYKCDNGKISVDTLKEYISDGVIASDIYSGFLMYLLPYAGSIEDTRLQVPDSLRKTDQWIAYIKDGNTIVTEKYIGNDTFNSAWIESENWLTDSDMSIVDITISNEGNWIVNGEDTGVKAQGERGITPLLRIKDNKLQVSYTEGTYYEDVNDTPIYTQFRWNSEEHDTTGYELGKIQASTDNGNTWSDFSGSFTNNLHIKGYVNAVESLPASAALGEIYGVGPTYASDDTEHTNPIYKLYVKADSGWVDNGKFTSISAGVVQELGDSEIQVMSQKAVTELCKTSSIIDSYSSISCAIDTVNGNLQCSSGYLFLGDKKAIFINQSNADFSSLSGIIYIVLSGTTSNLYTTSYESNISKEDYVIGCIDKSMNLAKINCRYLTLNGELLKNYTKQIFDSDSPNKYVSSQISMDFTNKTLSFTEGYVFNGRYNVAFNLNSGTLNITKYSCSYIVYSMSDKTLYVIEYTDALQNKNDIIVGFIDFTGERILINCRRLIINGEIVNLFFEEDRKKLEQISNLTPLPEEIITPTPDWPTKNFNSSSGTDGIFWDIRNKVSSFRRIKKIYVKSNSAGTVRIHYLTLNGETIYYEDKTVKVGTNEINPPDLSYAQEMYVGIQNITSSLMLRYPTDNTGQSRKKFLNDGHIVEQTYPYSYWLSIENLENTLPVRVSTLEQSLSSSAIKTFSGLKNAIQSGTGKVELGECDITLNEPLIIPTGTKIVGVRGKSILRVPQSVLKGIELNGIEDVVIQNVTIIGAYNGTPIKNELQPVKSGIVNTAEEAQQMDNIGYQTDLTNGGITSSYIPQIGININRCEKIEIIGCEIKNFSYYGIANALSGKNYRYACKFENNYINNCYCGLYLYKEAERSQYIANNVSLCQIGLYLDSGTNMFTDNAFSANRIGMFMNNGVNHAHGSQNGNAFTHCSLFSIYAFNVENGEVFSQCKFGYADTEDGNNGGYAIYLKNSRGLFFNNCQMIQCNIKFDEKFKLHYNGYSIGETDQFGNSNYIVNYTDISGQESQYNGGVNQLLGCSFISNGGNILLSSDLNNTNIILKHNYFITGQPNTSINN